MQEEADRPGKQADPAILSPWCPPGPHLSLCKPPCCVPPAEHLNFHTTAATWHLYFKFLAESLAGSTCLISWQRWQGGSILRYLEEPLLACGGVGAVRTRK